MQPGSGNREVDGRPYHYRWPNDPRHARLNRERGFLVDLTSVTTFDLRR
jgi:hypothetical protein